jgi:CubicO group peptidase (beta-lactamase class C family)
MSRGAAFALLAVLALGGAARAGEIDFGRVEEVLRAEILERIEVQRLPSIAAAAVVDGEIVFSFAEGYSNAARRVKATEGTLYEVGSTVKPITATAVMRLVEAGKVALDEPVNGRLGEHPVRNDHPGAKEVTLRHLLAHVSGLAGGAHMAPLFGPPPPALEELVRGLATTQPPETSVVYSNPGFALAGHLVARISGVPYEEFVRREILEPLEMDRTSFAPTPAMVEDLALPYSMGPDGPYPTAILRVGETPAGGAWSTVGDMASFLAMHLKDGKGEGARILSPESAREMRRRPFRPDEGEEGFGLAWLVRRSGERTTIRHSGGLPGYAAFLAGDVEAKAGIALASNLMEAGGALAALSEIALRLLRGEPHEEFDLASARRDPVPDEWHRYTGHYEAPRGTATVRIAGDLLVVDPAEGPTLLLVPREDGSFTLRGDGVPAEERIAFETGASGEVTGLRRRDGSLRPRRRSAAVTSMDLDLPPEGDFAGEWEGRVEAKPGGLRFALRIHRTPEGLTGRLDIPDQALYDAALEHVLHHGRTVHLELAVPGARAVAEGTLAGDAIRGSLLQAGVRTPLTAWRKGSPEPPPAAPPEASGPWVGVWEGEVELGPQSLSLRLAVSGEGEATLDVPAQGAAGLVLEAVARDGNRVRFELPSPAGRAVFEGTLDGDALAGTMVQAGQSFPFALRRAR